jgi:hypothetical protein
LPTCKNILVTKQSRSGFANPGTEFLLKYKYYDRELQCHEKPSAFWKKNYFLQLWKTLYPAICKPRSPLVSKGSPDEDFLYGGEDLTKKLEDKEKAAESAKRDQVTPSGFELSTATDLIQMPGTALYYIVSIVQFTYDKS